MGKFLFTFSGAERAVNCPASCALPQAKHVSPHANKGKAIHAYLAAVGRVGRDEALAAVPDEYRAACEAIDLSALPACDPDAFAAEVSLAYNVDTGEARELGRDLDRNYPDLGEGRWIPGTLDVLGLTHGGVIVSDYKTGWSYVSPADRNWQLRIGALAACRAYGKKEAHVSIIRGNVDPAEFDPASLGAFDLDMAAAEIQEAADRVEAAQADLAAGKPPEVVTGPHCDWCPAMHACPAHLAIARQLASDPEALADHAAALLGPESAPQAYAKLQDIHRVVDALDKAFEAYGRQFPFEVRPGVRFGPRPYSLEKLDGEVARDILAKEFDPQFVKDAIEPEATKKSVDRAVRKWIERTRSGSTISAANDKALAAIRQAGGVKKSTTYPVGEHKAKTA